METATASNSNGRAAQCSQGCAPYHALPNGGSLSLPVMHSPSPFLQLALALVCWASGLSNATAQTLPPTIDAALRAAGLPSNSLYVWVAPAGAAQPILSIQGAVPANPASLMKLVTSAVALAQLGPSYRWPTEVAVDERPDAGRLHGNVYLTGRGDPQLTQERLWLLLRELRSRGVNQIDGDIVLDRSAFALPEVPPGSFDGEPYKPYNVQPDALLVSLKAVTLQFRPAPEARVAQVSAEPALQGWQVPSTVPLSGEAECGDWRAQLKADFSDPRGPRFGGTLPALCGERSWPIAPPEPQHYNARAIAAMWQELGGRLKGQVLQGHRPSAALSLFSAQSASLGEVLRDMNKYSNNLIADQLLLTLALDAQGQGTWEGARSLVSQALQSRATCRPEEWVIDRGSGLSRTGRLSAQCLGRVLQWAWASPWMPELVASLPVAGEDTARRATAGAGRAHLKTGSLEGVAGLAGYVDGPAGQRYVLVALLNHPRAGEPRSGEVLNAVLRWTVEQADTRR
jgi:serine-type D-Ala-D-Ala carboxypeptidase/endopeptidase (penicillin-binding protein 4)